MNCEPIPEPNAPGFFICTRCQQRLSNISRDFPTRKNCPALAGKQPEVIEPGVGAALHQLLDELGLKEKEGCGCTQWRLDMDRNGIDWVKSHRDEVIAQLESAAAKLGWLDTLKTGAKLVRQPWFRPLAAESVAGQMLDEAIRRAELTAAGGAG